jgi:hypothetical protein
LRIMILQGASYGALLRSGTKDGVQLSVLQPRHTTATTRECYISLKN